MQRRFTSLAVICFSLISLSMNLSAQSSNTQCPTVEVDCPTDCYKSGEPFTVTARVTGADPNKSLSYNWTISRGVINGGQGTATITVVRETNCETFTATVEVTGLDAECPNTASCTSVTHCCFGVSRPFDRFGDLAFADEKKRLDYFAEQLEKEPGSQAHIIVYGKRGAPRAGEAQARADRAKDYLVNKRGIAAERIKTVDGGLRERLKIELWIVPQGALPPPPEEQEQ
jgi:hypothetical protein